MNVSKQQIIFEGQFQHLHATLATAQSELRLAQSDMRVLRQELEAAREARRETSDILRDVLYSASVATFLLDRDLQLEFFTPVAESLFRMLSSDIGRPFAELALAADDTGLEADVDSVISGQDRERSGVVAVHGRWYGRKVLPRRSRDQMSNGVVISYIDITELKAAHGFAEAARNQIRQLIAGTRLPVALFDEEFRLELAGDSFAAALSAHRPLLQRAVAAIRRSAPDGRSEAPSEAAPEFELEIEGVGQIRMALHTLDAAPGAPGAASPLHIVSTSVDRFGGRAAGRLIADPAHLSETRHEIIQPLQSLRLLHDVLLRRSANPAEVALLKRLEEASEALTGLLDSMFLQEEQHRDALMIQNDQDVTLGDVMKPLKLELGYFTAARGVRWRAVDCSLHVRTDPRLLRCLIRGLVLQALRTTSGGRLLLGCRRVGTDIRLEIWHSGGASSSRAQSKQILVRPEFVDSLAEVLRVEVELHDVRDQGPICSLRMPRVVPAPAAAARRAGPRPTAKAEEVPLLPPGPASACNRRSVCLVDDDESFLRSVTIALDGVGVDAITFRSVDALLEEYRDCNAECLIIDARMPEMDGFSLIERLRDENCPLPFVMITGAGDVQMAVRAMKAGAADFIEKPVTVEQLLESMDRARDLAAARSLQSDRPPGRQPDRPGRAADREGAGLPGGGGGDGAAMARHDRTMSGRARMFDLTARQIEVMDLVVEGHANKEIAARLKISQRTVENHRAAVMRRTGARSLPHLIRMRLSPPEIDPSARPGPPGMLGPAETDRKNPAP